MNETPAGSDTVPAGNAPEIVPADENVRRWSALAATVLACLALMLMLWLDRLQGDILARAQRDLPAAVAKAHFLVDLFVVIGGLGLIAIAVWFWRFGGKVVRGERFPPLGTKVIRPTPLRTGVKARRLGYLAWAVALACLILGTLGMWWLHRLAAALLRLG